MAWIRDIQPASANANTITPPAFTSETGDLLIQVVISDVGGITWGVPTGYTSQAVQTGGSLSSRIFTKVATSSETPQSSSHGGSAYDVQCWLVVVADVDGTTPVDVVQIDSSSTQTPQAPALATTADGTFNLYFFGTDTSNSLRKNSLEPGLMWLDKQFPGLAVEVAAGWTHQTTAGAIDRPTIENNSSRSTHRLCICIAPNTGQVPAYSPYSSPATTVIHPLHGTAVYPSYGGANRDVSVSTELNADINGNVFNYNAGSLSSFEGLNGVEDSYQASTPSSGSALQQWGTGWDFTSVDLTGKMIAVGINATLQIGSKGLADDGLVFGLRSSAGNFRLWAVGGKDTNPKINQWNPIIIDVDSTAYRIEDKGTFNSATAQGMVLSSHKAIAGIHSRVGANELQIVNTNVIVGGSADSPATLTTFVDSLKASVLGLVQAQQGASTKQVISFMKLQIGNGTDLYFKDPNSSLEIAKAYSSSEKKIQLQVPAGVLGITIYGVSGNTVDLSNIVMFGENDWYYTIHASSTSAATWTADAHTVIGATVTLQDVYTAMSGITFTGCGEITHNSADLSGGCTIDSSIGTQSITFTGATQTALQALIDNVANCTFTNNAVAIRIEYTGTGDVSLNMSGINWSGNTTDIHYNSTNSSALTAVMQNGSNATTFAISGSATGVTISSPTFDLDVAVNVSATIRVFTTGTQTQLATATGTTLTYTHSNETVDITVWKAGYQQQRLTSIDLTDANVIQPFTLVDVPAYNGSHGLSYTTDITYNRGTKEFDPVTRQLGRNLYSALVDAFDAQSSLHNTDLNLRMDGPVNAIFLDGSFIKVASEDNWYGAGIEYRDSSDVVQDQWVSFVSTPSSDFSGATAEYQTTPGVGQTDARSTGSINQIVKVYDNGVFDYRSAFVWKFQVNGYIEARTDIIDSFGISALEPTQYVFPMIQTAISAAVGDPGIAAPTFTDHAGTPVTWNGKDFSYTLQSSESGENLLRELNYFMSLDADWEGESPFNRHNMILEAGSSYETQRGIHEGGIGAALKGVRILNGSGNAHPDFTRFQSDDGTYYTPDIVANVSVTGMDITGADINLQIWNIDSLTAAAWQASTAYSVGDMRLRTSGIGGESTAGLYMRCTTAGTSGSTEPTWDTTVGNTTSDGTVTWTTYAVLFYDADPGSATLGVTYTTGDEFNTGESYGFRFAELDGTTSFKIADGTGIVSSAGFSFAVSTTADAIYASNAIDGSAQTHFAANFALDYIALATDTDFTVPQGFAYYCYTLTLSAGMWGFWDGMTAIDAGNYRINTDTLNLYMDETIGAFVKQQPGDNSRLFRDDGTRPVLDPTTGGYGVEINWKNPVQTISTGSVLTSSEKVELSAAAAKPTATEIVDEWESQSQSDPTGFQVNVKEMNSASVHGDGTSADKWRGV